MASTPQQPPRSTGTSSPAGNSAKMLLQRQLKEMRSAKDLPGISVGLVNDNNMLVWEVVLMINDETKYYGGKAGRHPIHIPATTFTQTLAALYTDVPTCAQEPTSEPS
jgi:hypothetical protein